MTCYTSVFDLFSVGIGPSSSHTVGPMRAAKLFGTTLIDENLLTGVDRISVQLLGSLGATGIGHGTPQAVLAGLVGEDPETVNPSLPNELAAQIESEGTLNLMDKHRIRMNPADIELHPHRILIRHTNAVVFNAFSATGELLLSRTYYSTGGGFVEEEGAPASVSVDAELPYPYQYASDLLDICEREGLSIAEIAFANECALRPPEAVNAGLDRIWAAMRESISTGLDTRGTLPGVLKARRRAAAIAEQLRSVQGERETSLEWLQAYAIAVNEENAAGGRVVTAPTNGAAGIIPAVMFYFIEFLAEAMDEVKTDAVRRYLLTATAIGSLYKGNASISGAEAGCQGEVGSASSMAAGALCEILGGTPAQVENAAEIAMEHNLGLTCDPVAGLVQLPCIERNAIAAGKAVASARMALYGDGQHMVSLDTVIETMRQTGRDMSTKYKETSEGGLAVNVIEC